MTMTAKEIMAQVSFQEQYFKIEMIEEKAASDIK